MKPFAPFRPAPCSSALLWLLLALWAIAVKAQGQQPETASWTVLDRAVAVVNRRVILASDLDDEIRLSVLDPNNAPQQELTRQQALEKLISRTLIEQQIRQEDIPAIEPTQKEVDARLMNLRRELPVCVRQNCATDAGWSKFLAARGLNEQRVERYLRYRLEILRFIEQRFRQGIQISEKQVEAYYRDTLVPQYTVGEAVPQLSQVAPRIQEILLQQEVNVMFDAWLNNLRQQGDVELLDPALAADATPAPQDAVGPDSVKGSRK